MQTHLIMGIGHAFGIYESISLEKIIHKIPYHLYFYGVAGKLFETTHTMSLEIQSLVPKTGVQIFTHIHNWRKKCMNLH